MQRENNAAVLEQLHQGGGKREHLLVIVREKMGKGEPMGKSLAEPVFRLLERKKGSLGDRQDGEMERTTIIVCV